MQIATNFDELKTPDPNALLVVVILTGVVVFPCDIEPNNVILLSRECRAIRDKLKRGPQKNAVLSVKRQVPESVTVQAFSATKKLGLEQLESTMNEWLA